MLKTLNLIQLPPQARAVDIVILYIKAWFPSDRPDRPDRPNRPSRLKKNVQTTGTIIWKRYPDDRK